MKYCLSLLFTLLSLFICNSNYAQTGKLGITKEPDWITKNKIDYNQTSLDKDAADGYMDMCFETQTSLAHQSRYVRCCRKIISQAGVQNGSEISESYDPSYEQLNFHSIFILRNGEKLNRLKLSDIKTVHQETELKNFIYNGSLNAVIVLEDVRQGDIIEYSYSRTGFNPIFKNKYAGVLHMEYSVPVYQLYHKLIVPAGRKINIKNLNESQKPVISTVNGQQQFEWHKTNLKPVQLQDYTPDWYDPYAQVLLSEYSNWKEVNDWAMELFPVKKELSAAVQKKIKEIELANPVNAERIKAALRFVQDEIRYMGIEIGENSHKPADPSKVFAQRFGDCKEKSYLLCCMLNAMNIEAEPVLINTLSKKEIQDFLPAPIDFNHVTVRVKLDNEFLWFDPTIAYQRGDIKNIFFPDYQTGLVISANTISLTPIAFRNLSSQHVKGKYTISSASDDVMLKITTSFYGGEADGVRDNFNNQSIRELMTGYQKFYAGYYDQIKADSLNFTDDETTGVFTTVEYYRIPDLWKADKSKVSRFSFYPFVINSVIKRPKEKDRNMPFFLSFPAKYKEEIDIEMPENWTVTENEIHLKNSSFSYNSRFFCVANHVYLEADYENYKNHVTIDDASGYFEALGEYDDNSSFEVSLGKSDALKSDNTGSKTNYRKILYIVLVLVVGIGGLIWWSQRN